MHIIGSLREEFTHFKDMIKIGRIFQLLPVLIYIFFYKYLRKLKNSGCKEYAPKKYKIINCLTLLLLGLHCIVLVVGPESIIMWVIKNNLMDFMALFKTVMVVVMVYYFMIVIGYINGLKEKCKKDNIIDDIMVTYSKITIMIIVIGILMSFYLMNILVHDEIKKVF